MRFVCFVVGMALLGGQACAQQASLKPDSDADAVLDALHARGQGLKDFSANVTMTTTNERTGESFSQSGKVVYHDRDGNGRIRVSFDKRKHEDGATQEYKVDYLLQDGWLVDRDHRKKLEVKRQVLKPGQKMNLLKLGEGPFPLPIGQPKEDVKKQFDVSKIAPEKDDPRETAHLKLVPKPDTRFARQFKQIDVYVDLKSNMPARIDTTEKAGNARSTELSTVKINAGVADKDFDLENLDGKNWSRREEPFD